MFLTVSIGCILVNMSFRLVILCLLDAFLTVQYVCVFFLSLLVLGCAVLMRNKVFIIYNFLDFYFS